MTRRLMIEIVCERCSNTSLVEGSTGDLGQDTPKTFPDRWGRVRFLRYGSDSYEQDLCASCIDDLEQWLARRNPVGSPMLCKVVGCGVAIHGRSVYCKKHWEAT